MATDIYSSITNPVSGETFRCISSVSDAYTMQWTLQPKGYVPFEHVHYHQDEIFDVRTGELKVVIDGISHVARAGERIVVPKGAAHIASNNSSEIMDAIVTYVPALDYETFMKCLCGLTLDGFMDEKGGISIPMMGYCIKRMKCKAMSRPTNIPAPAFKMALNAFYVLGSVKGWGKHYLRYTS